MPPSSLTGSFRKRWFVKGTVLLIFVKSICKTINLQNVAPEQQLLKMGLSSNSIKNHYLFMILLILNCLLQNFWSSFSVKKKIKAFCAAQTSCFHFSNNSYRNCSVWILFLMCYSYLKLPLHIQVNRPCVRYRTLSLGGNLEHIRTADHECCCTAASLAVSPYTPKREHREVTHVKL